MMKGRNTEKKNFFMLMKKERKKEKNRINENKLKNHIKSKFNCVYDDCCCCGRN